MQKETGKQLKVMSDILRYLKSYNIYFEVEECREEETLHITMVFKGCKRCPGRFTEGSIYFYDDCMEVRVYYSELGSKICKESDNLSDLYRLMNYLNVSVWTCATDGREGALYESVHLVSPRFCITEDGMQDITTVMVIPYSHFESDVLEIEDYITAALPELLDSLSAPIFLLLAGKIKVEESINMVRKEVLGEGIGFEIPK